MLICNGVVARRKTLFDDRPVEIAELTYVIKQDLSSLNSQISSLQSLSKSQHAQVTRTSNVDQEGEHNKNVYMIFTLTMDSANKTGCCPSPRQACRCIREFQRSPRSPHQEHTSLSIPHGELRLLSLRTIPYPARPPEVRLTLVQHSYQITYSISRLSELPFRHPEPRPVFNHDFGQRRHTVGPATSNDGGGAAHQLLHHRSRRSHRSNREDNKRAGRYLRPAGQHGFGAKVSSSATTKMANG